MNASRAQSFSRQGVGGKTSERVIRYLVGYIRRNQLAPGAKLPSEVQTSAELQVSRGIVREAYRSLSSAGVVEIANGRSPRVSHLSNRAFTQLIQHALSTQQISAEQVLELRGPIECRAAELAAKRRTEYDIAALKRHVAAMRAAGSRREPFVRADIRFHEIIGRATGNPLFGLIASALRESLEASMRAGFESRTSRAELNQVIEAHAAIVNAIDAGSARDARRLMSDHFEDARAAIPRHEMERLTQKMSPEPRVREERLRRARG